MTVGAGGAKAVGLGLLSLAVAVLFQTAVASAGGFTPSCFPGNPCGLNIEKLVNGQDADTAPGITVPVGSVVTFTYLVTTTVTANNPLVLDDNGTPGFTADDFFATLVSGDTSDFFNLDPNETWTFTAQGPALLGLHTNIGTVGQLACITVTFCSFNGIDTDPASYTGVVPAPASLMLIAITLAGFALLTQLRGSPRTL